MCWLEFYMKDCEDDEKWECAIVCYDEVVGFLVDEFGEKFKYEDPRISDDNIDKNNWHGQFEIVLDEDDRGEEAPFVAIWKTTI